MIRIIPEIPPHVSLNVIFSIWLQDKYDYAVQDFRTLTEAGSTLWFNLLYEQTFTLLYTDLSRKS